MTFIDLLELISALGAEAIVLLQRFAAIGAIACGRLLLFRHIACAVLAEVLVQLVRGSSCSSVISKAEKRFLRVALEN